MITKPTKKRSATDWGGIEREFRAGQLSGSEIARRYEVSEGAIRKRAKRDQWSKDLTAQVQQAVRSKLAQADGTSGTSGSTSPRSARTDAEIVDQASDRGVAVVELHRADIAQIDRVKRILLTRLEAHLDGREVDGPCFGEKESPADLLEKLSRVTQRSITLGRQAHNLDDTKGSGNTLAELIAMSMPPEERARLPHVNGVE